MRHLIYPLILSSSEETTMKKEIKKRVVKILYKNWRGETSLRTILPGDTVFGSNEWHPEEQWFLKALDLDKNAERIFAMKDISAWFPWEFE